MTIAVALAYLAASLGVFRWGIRNVNRFRWHSHKTYFCYGAPCSQCVTVMALAALFWPLTLIVLRPDSSSREMLADRAAKEAMARGATRDAAWQTGVEAYEGRVVQFEDHVEAYCS